MSTLMPAGASLAPVMAAVARELLGEPNPRFSSERELRFGTHGSLSVDIVKGTWFDHEADQGGGVLDLIGNKRRCDHGAASGWLRERKLIEGQSAWATPRIAAAYDYTDATGALLLQVVRYDPKDFRQRGPDWQGGWTWKGGAATAIYRLPAIVEAIANGEPIYVAEGEKAADALAGLGLAATCSPGGANKWRAEHGAALTGAHVVILPDNDDAGRRHAAQVAASLADLAYSCHVVALPGLPEKGDPFDWIAAGGTVAQMEELVVAVAATETEPSEGVKDEAKQTAGGRFKLLDTAALLDLPERGYLLKVSCPPASCRSGGGRRNAASPS
mgnify:CR=1 FL=1